MNCAFIMIAATVWLNTCNIVSLEKLHTPTSDGHRCKILTLGGRQLHQNGMYFYSNFECDYLSVKIYEAKK